MRIAECFGDTIAYVVAFLKTADTQRQSCEQVKGRIMSLLAASQHSIEEIDPDAYYQARFALCAWIDERLIQSAWSDSEVWSNQTLAMQVYQIEDAGTVFFERLAVLPRHQQQVREVFYLCMAMGFTGRYASDKGKVRLEKIKTRTLKVLTGRIIGVPRITQGLMFPAAYASGGKNSGTTGGFSARHLVCLVLPPAFVAALYAFYYLVLVHVGNGFVTRLVP